MGKKMKVNCLAVSATFEMYGEERSVCVIKGSTREFTDEDIARAVGEALEKLFNEYYYAWFTTLKKVTVHRREIEVEVEEV